MIGQPFRSTTQKKDNSSLADYIALEKSKRVIQAATDDCEPYCTENEEIQDEDECISTI
jgi:hypothetical protein